MLFFIPLLPGSGIFSTFNGTLFWVIFSLSNLEYDSKNKKKIN
jgi:H+/gluconate symporter-like permease